jgi:hypothetical protein
MKEAPGSSETQKTPFFIVTAVKTSNLTENCMLWAMNPNRPGILRQQIPEARAFRQSEMSFISPFYNDSGA